MEQGRSVGPRDRCGVKVGVKDPGIDVEEVGGKDPGIDVELGRRKGPRDRCGAR